MELQIIRKGNTEIQFNHEELKKVIEEKIVAYNNAVYTEDDIKNAKEDRANLNKLKTAIDDKRKEIKKEVMKPYDEFEVKAKEIMAIIEQPILKIDNTVKEFEVKLKEEKRIKIIEIYNETFEEVNKNMVSLEKIFDDKWLNASVTIKSITEDIAEINNNINVAVNTLKLLNSEYENTMLATYYRTLDLSKAISEGNLLAEQEKKMKENNIIKEKVVEPVIPGIEKLEEVIPDTVKQVEVEKDNLSIKLEIFGTKEELKKLHEYITKENLKYIKL